MGSALKQKWREFQHGHPGRRFQERYERHQRTRQDRPWHAHFLKIALAIALILMGVVLMFIPGPAILFFAVGAGLLSDHSRALARLLDWTEVKARQALAAAKTWWERASVPARGGVMMLGVFGTAGAGYLAYRILIQG